MKTSESIAELSKALAGAQQKLPTVPKTKKNPYFKSNYADLAIVVETVAPIITEFGLSVSQLPDYDAENDRDLLTTRLLHVSGQWLEASMCLRPGKADPQGQGSAITYARRYAYCAILGIVADEDDDGNAASRPATKTKTTEAVPDGMKSESEVRLEIAKSFDRVADRTERTAIKKEFSERFGVPAKVAVGQLEEAHAWVLARIANP